MPRQSPIRVTAKDRQLINKINKSARAKKGRLRRTYGVQTPEVRVRPISSFTSRREFNDYVNEIRSFTNRYNVNYQFVKNKNGVVIPKKTYNEIKRTIDIQNRQKKKAWNQISKEEYRIAGKPQKGFTVGQRAGFVMGDSMYSVFRPTKFNFDTFTSAGQVIEYKNRFLARGTQNWLDYKNTLYKENYLKAIDKVFGNSGNYLKSLVDRVPANQLAMLFYTENLGEIDFIYNYSEQMLKLNSLVDYFERLVGEGEL